MSGHKTHNLRIEESHLSIQQVVNWRKFLQCVVTEPNSRMMLNMTAHRDDSKSLRCMSGLEHAKCDNVDAIVRHPRLLDVRCSSNSHRPLVKPTLHDTLIRCTICIHRALKTAILPPAPMRCGNVFSCICPCVCLSVCNVLT